MGTDECIVKPYPCSNNNRADYEKYFDCGRKKSFVNSASLSSPLFSRAKRVQLVVQTVYVCMMHIVRGTTPITALIKNNDGIIKVW